ncbi:unnamed protein product, partial [Didymodactylos carnosus]
LNNICHRRNICYWLFYRWQKRKEASLDFINSTTITSSIPSIEQKNHEREISLFLGESIDAKRFSNFDHSMLQFMRSIYEQVTSNTRKRRSSVYHHLYQIGSDLLSKNIDFILSMPNSVNRISDHDSERSKFCLPTKSNYPMNKHAYYHFDLDKSNHSLANVIHADFVLFTAKRITQRVYVNLYRIVNSSTCKYSQPRIELIDRQKIPIKTRHQWLRLNLTRQISLMKSHSQQFNTPLLVTITNSFGHKLEINKYLSLTNNQGFTILYFNVSTNNTSIATTRNNLFSHENIRKRRSQDNNDIKTIENDQNYCQPRRLQVKFEDLEWNDFILEPQSYEANYCAGNCPTAQNMNSHFIIQNKMNRLDSRIPQPCCVPAEYSSTVLLHYDGPNLILKRYDDMRVTKCRCI